MVMENFEAMFESSLKSIKVGTVIEGEILSIIDDEVFVNLGYKADGIICRGEFSFDENIKPADKYKIGDKIKVYILKLNDGRGNVLLSTKRLEAEKNKEDFDNIVSKNEIISAKVTQLLEKGVRVNYKGIQIFIPLSHLISNNVNDYAGKTIELKVIENEKNRVIGSQKIAVKEKNTEKKNQVLSTIKEGDIVNGTVKRINEYGAFVDIGGIEGLLHISQITWKRNADPKDYVEIEQNIDVEILSIDRENKKIALKTKKDNENPWNKIGTEYNIGTIVQVKIEKIVPFGVFVQIEEGLDGFIHISQISNKIIQKPEDVLTLEQIVEAKIVEIDTEKGRIELSIRALENIDKKSEIEENS